MASPPDRSTRSRYLRRRRVVRWTLIVFGVVVLLLAADAAYSVLAVSREVRSARDALERGAERLEAGDVAGAKTAFGEAAEAAEAASAASRHPAVKLASALPGMGDDVEAVGTLTEATQLAAAAGGRFAEAAEAVGWDGESIPGYSPGRFDLDVIQAATPALEEAAPLLEQAEALLGTLDPDGKLGSIADAIRTGQDVLGERASQAARAVLVARLLPGFLGADEPRAYGLVMMTLSDPRGSGGFPGSFGVLHVEDGAFELEELAPTSTLGKVPRVEAPIDVVRRYARFGGLTHFISSTYSPDWPTAAQIWREMWEASGREPLDGVIASDSVWMSYVLEALGPVDTPAWPETITAENVSQVLDADTQRTLDHDQSDAWQAGIATALWQAVVTGSLPPEGIGSALTRSAAERHLQVYSAHVEEQSLLDELGASGRLEAPENPLMVSWSGFTANRAGYFAEKSISYQATINEDGTADVVVSVSLTNTAPTEPESILLGTEADNFPVGTYAAAASIYLPAEATAITSKVDGGGSLVKLFEREFERRVVLTVLVADSGQTTTAQITYRMPADAASFELGIVPQPELRPSPVSVSVTFPSGREILEASPGATVEGSTFHYEGVPTSPLTVAARTA